jgi:hypothetical protein
MTIVDVLMSRCEVEKLSVTRDPCFTRDQGVSRREMNINLYFIISMDIPKNCSETMIHQFASPPRAPAFGALSRMGSIFKAPFHIQIHAFLCDSLVDHSP